MTNAILECMIERIAQTQIVSEPIDHLHIEEFPPDKEAHTLAGEFAAWQDAAWQDAPWHSYDNAIEHKKTCNTWNSFEATTNRNFLAVNCQAMCRAIEEVKPASIENRENTESLKCAGINILPRLPNNS